MGYSAGMLMITLRLRSQNLGLADPPRYAQLAMDLENPPLNSAMPGVDMEIEFDVWPRTYSKYTAFGGTDLLNVHVWNAIERGAWAVREFHSVSESDTPAEDGSEGSAPPLLNFPLYVR